MKQLVLVQNTAQNCYIKNFTIHNLFQNCTINSNVQDCTVYKSVQNFTIQKTYKTANPEEEEKTILHNQGWSQIHLPGAKKTLKSLPKMPHLVNYHHYTAKIVRKFQKKCS